MQWDVVVEGDLRFDIYQFEEVFFPYQQKIAENFGK